MRTVNRWTWVCCQTQPGGFCEKVSRCNWRISGKLENLEMEQVVAFQILHVHWSSRLISRTYINLAKRYLAGHQATQKILVVSSACSKWELICPNYNKIAMKKGVTASFGGKNLGLFLLSYIHPWRLTWNIIMEVWKIMFLSKWVICRFHVI